MSIRWMFVTITIMGGAGLPAIAHAGPDYCTINSVRYERGDVNPQNTCEVCLPGQSYQDWSAVDVLTQCDDGNVCTSDNVCVDGACTGVPTGAPGCPGSADMGTDAGDDTGAGEADMGTGEDPYDAGSPSPDLGPEPTADFGSFEDLGEVHEEPVPEPGFGDEDPAAPTADGDDARIAEGPVGDPDAGCRQANGSGSWLGFAFVLAAGLWRRRR